MVVMWRKKEKEDNGRVYIRRGTGGGGLRQPGSRGLSVLSYYYDQPPDQGVSRPGLLLIWPFLCSAYSLVIHYSDYPLSIALPAAQNSSEHTG